MVRQMDRWADRQRDRVRAAGQNSREDSRGPDPGKLTSLCELCRHEPGWGGGRGGSHGLERAPMGSFGLLLRSGCLRHRGTEA